MRTSTTATPRVRTRLAAALAICALPAATLVWAAPAHAAHPVSTWCTVNDSEVVAKSQTVITGTPAKDVIVCDGVADFTIDGQGGDDEITVTGAVMPGGSVLGGAGNDMIHIEGAVLGDGKVVGGDGNDNIVLDGAVVGKKKNQKLGGLVDGGAGDDTIALPNVGGSGDGATVLGGLGNDTIRGYDFSDPAATDGRVTVGGHTATLDGGAGTDMCAADPIKSIAVENSLGGTVKNCES